KIALGSGGLFGKGFLLGTQTHLSFLPEKQTDFIFTMIAEEFGLVGGLILLGLYVVVIGYAFAIALRSRSLFGRLLGLGIAANFFLYVFINTAMVMPHPGRRGAAAADFLRRNRYDHDDAGVWPADERRGPPRRSHQPARRERARLIPWQVRARTLRGEGFGRRKGSGGSGTAAACDGSARRLPPPGRQLP